MSAPAKYTRQARLVEIGERGQALLSATRVCVPEGGLAREIEARYLVGAGVEVERSAHEGAEGADPTESDPEPGHVFADPAAREVAQGARRALEVILRALAGSA